jgi:hypothetical protein
MAGWKVRRIAALLLALALAVGGTLNVVQAADMSAKMAVSETSMPMPNGCNGCGGDDQGMTPGCFALCGTMVAVLPAVPLVAAGTLVSSTATGTTAIAGLHGPPDPYPPRPAILS